MGLKPWMQALVWLGLGGGIGFFAGYRIGCRQSEQDLEEIRNQVDTVNETTNDMVDKYEKQIVQMRHDFEAALDAQREYLGGKDDETVSVGQIEMDLGQDVDDDLMHEPPEMPDEEDEEEEIPQLHPEDLRPFGITRTEYLANEKGYDQVQLDYYTEDCVIFDPEREEKWTHPEQLLGLGWKAMFISTGDKPVREAYVQNDTMEVLYKITRIDDSFERLYEEE